MDTSDKMIERLRVDNGVVVRTLSEIDTVFSAIIYLDVIDSGIVGSTVKLDAHDCRSCRYIIYVGIICINLDVVDDDVVLFISIEDTFYSSSSVLRKSCVVITYQCDTVSIENESVSIDNTIFVFTSGEDVDSMVFERIRIGECPWRESLDLECRKRTSIRIPIFCVR